MLLDTVGRLYPVLYVLIIYCVFYWELCKGALCPALIKSQSVSKIFQHRDRAVHESDRDSGPFFVVWGCLCYSSERKSKSMLD